LNVCHISTHDTAGGAARAAYRLHWGLGSLDIESRMLVAFRSGAEKSIRTWRHNSSVLIRLRRWLYRNQVSRDYARYQQSRPQGYELFTDDRCDQGLELWAQLRDIDIVNLHWVSGMLDYRTFFSSAPEHISIVWTLHDMNPFTGGCHYEDGCARYLAQCGACPQLGATNPGDLSHQVWRRKRRSFQQLRDGQLHVVTPSRWLAEAARASSLFATVPTTVIPYGLDTADFAPRDKLFSRDLLSIPADAAVVLFAADSVNNRRKGVQYLIDALNGLQLDNLFLLSVGGGQLPIASSVPYLHLGKINNDLMLSVVYSAADLFVIPSVQDNLPNTVLESMACGTPVVGFDVGGIPDMVRPGVTGLLSPVGDVNALREAIASLLQDPMKRAELSANCRQTVLNEYTLEIQACNYLKLYQSLLM
jgi:glycosyltransferase involved in cell wall biosynthesis